MPRRKIEKNLAFARKTPKGEGDSKADQQRGSELVQGRGF